jgi:hypothetical protein
MRWIGSLPKSGFPRLPASIPLSRNAIGGVGLKLVKCANCGREVWKYPYSLKNKSMGVFCSRNCSYAYRKSLVNSDEIIELYEAGRSLREIEEQTGVTSGTVLNRLKERGVNRRDIDIAREIGNKRQTVCAKRSRAMTGRKATLDTRNKISIQRTGAGNPQWKGGISYGQYCQKFTKALKESVREQFGRRCYLCGTAESTKKHHVHHCDYNKSQGCAGLKWSLIPLCVRCHAKTGSRRWYWFALLRDYWIYDQADFFSKIGGFEIS